MMTNFFVFLEKTNKKISMKNLLVLIVISLFINCTKTEQVEIVKEFDGPKVDKAVAMLHPIGDSNVTGMVTFERAENGSSITAEINGLSAGNHGFHIHQYGDCSASDGTSAGGHFNPEDMEHSARDAEKRHVGDMGNIESEGPNTTTTLNYVDSHISLEEIVGRGVIIHAGEDDLTSQPSGAAGSRIACGVIGIAQTP